MTYVIHNGLSKYLCANCGEGLGYESDKRKDFREFEYCPYCGEKFEDTRPVHLEDLTDAEYERVIGWL